MLYSTSKNIYETSFNKNDFDSHYENNLIKMKSFRLYSCNHIIHFKCYETLVLKSINENSSYEYRTKIANINNIKNYTGTSIQNQYLLKLLKEGKLIKL